MIAQTYLPCSALVVIQEDTVIAVDRKGQNILSRRAGEDDASVIQAAIDYARPGGEVKISAGTYRLPRSLVIDYPILLSGEGRSTVLVPPPKDFALRIAKSEQSPTRKEYVYGPDHIVDGFPDQEKRLYGVGVCKLAICGLPSGKGIYLNDLVESWFKDLWIIGTHDGAAIYIDSTVMECEFQSIHCFSNGSREAEEATIVIAGQRSGDANNNLHFNSVYVQNNNFIGVEIGKGSNRSMPRLLFFHHCMFHSWLPITNASPYDLIRITACDGSRGTVVSASRFTHAGAEQSYIHVVQGGLRLSDCILGGGTGRYAVYAESNAQLSIHDNTFHPRQGGIASVSARGAHLSLRDNILVGPGQGFELTELASTAISGNRFSDQV